jgi:integrase
MSIITPSKPASNITKAKCEAKVAKRTKFYDSKVGGLYASLSPTAPASFWLKFTNRASHSRSTIKVGVYHPELFTVDHARTAALALKWRIASGEDVAQSRRLAKALQAKLSGTTVGQLIDGYVEYMKQPERKADGEMRPRTETRANVASHLARFIRPRVGGRIASEVTKGELVLLSDDIVAGKFGVPSVSNARHARRAASGLFRWAVERDFVAANPCLYLPKLDQEHPRQRRLSEDEIRTLWIGLDRPDLPWNRQTVLAIRFALVTMLRSTELLHIHRSELNHDNGEPSVDIAARRVKRRRVINQPLSDLAMQIVNEALQIGDHEYLFPGRFDDAPLARSAMAIALRGTPKTKGLCELLGLEPFTPHDLRRTAATLCGELDLSEAGISLCLDHQSSKDENGKPLPAITRKHYNLATRIIVTKKAQGA